MMAAGKTPHFDEAVANILDREKLATSLIAVADSPTGRIERTYGMRYDDRPASLEDIAALYCTAKPILSLAFLSLAEERGLDLDMQLDATLPWMSGHWIGRLSYADLLGHRTTLHRLGAVIPMAAEPAIRGDLLRQLPEGTEEDGIGYADFGAWYVLAQTVEFWTNRDFRGVVFERVLQPYGIRLDELNLGIPSAQFYEWYPRLSLNMYRREDSGFHPLAAEGAPIWACEWNPTSCSYGTADGLVKLYRGVLADREGAGRVLSHELAVAATTPGESFYDVRLKHDSRYGLGFMADMSLFRCGPDVSPRSFGQSGVGAGSLAFADPEHDLAVAVLINSVHDETPTLLNLRHTLVTALYRDLGLPTKEQS